MKSTSYILSILVFLLPFAHLRAGHAQVVEDGTAGTTVDPTTLGITDGTTAGSNLFHSFEQFSVGPGETATFINDNPTVLNIIGRVTGTLPSDIHGEIAAGGTSANFDLFLINPNGITFSDTATLNVNGSFFVSTAESVVFDNGVYSTDLSVSTNPVLLLNVPTGLQLGTNSSGIDVQGDLFLDRSNTLGILGNGVNFNGASIALTEGNIEIGSIGENNRVTLDSESQFNYDSVSIFQDLTFSNQASVSASAGNINAYGRTINVEGGSGIAVNPTGAGLDGGTLQVIATDAVNVDGGFQLTPTNFLPSGFFAQNLGGTGNAGTIKIQAPNVALVNGGVIFNTTTGSGSGGITDINATNQLLIRGESVVGSPSGIFSEAIDATAPGGNITINTGDLMIENGARISAAESGGTMGAGNIFITANDVELSNQAAVIGLTTSGSGGNVTFDVEGDIIMRFNSLISAQSLGTGDGGNIEFDVEGFILTTLPENNDVLANSALGQGGQITGEASGILGFREFMGVVTSESDFTATGANSSLDGIVDVQIQENQPQQPLPQNLATRDVAQGCSAATLAALKEGTQSSLQIVGNGGIPDQPANPNINNNLWVIPVDPIDNASDETSTLSNDEGLSIVETPQKRTVALFCAIR